LASGAKLLLQRQVMLFAMQGDQRLDLVVAVGASAVRLFQRYRAQYFPSTPMLAIAEGRRIPTSDLAENDIAISTSIDLARINRQQGEAGMQFL
jgi:hypothetical protein